MTSQLTDPIALAKKVCDLRPLGVHQEDIRSKVLNGVQLLGEERDALLKIVRDTFKKTHDGMYYQYGRQEMELRAKPFLEPPADPKVLAVMDLLAKGKNGGIKCEKRLAEMIVEKVASFEERARTTNNQPDGFKIITPVVPYTRAFMANPPLFNDKLNKG